MHCQPFTTKEAIFKAGVILIACKVWAKRGVAACLFNMGGVGSELFFDQVDDQLCDFATNDKEEIIKYTTFIRKGTDISNFKFWRFLEDGKKADSVQHQIIQRTLSIKTTDNEIRRHFVQCATQSGEKQMISPKIPKLFLALAKSSKLPFVRNDIKLLNSQEWTVIEMDVRSENCKNCHEFALSSVSNQMKEKTGEMPSLDAAASKLGRRANQGAVCSVANQMKEKTGIMPTLEAAASKLGRRGNQVRMDKIVIAGIASKDASSFAGRRASDNRRICTIFCATEKCKNTMQYKDGHCQLCHDLLPKLITEFCIGVGSGGLVCEKVKFYQGNQCRTCDDHPDKKRMREAKKAAEPKCTIDGCRRTEYRSCRLCSKHYPEQC